jgi:hypothetical protein
MPCCCGKEVIFRGDYYVASDRSLHTPDACAECDEYGRMIFIAPEDLRGLSLSRRKSGKDSHCM